MRPCRGELWRRPDQGFRERLRGHLWHATDHRAVRAILASGSVRSDATPRYANGFCRSIGAVSLFDFAEMDRLTPGFHWTEWLLRPGEVTYWLQVDRTAAAPAIVEPAELLERYNRTVGEHCGARLVGGLEAAHVGPVPLDHVSAILRVRNEPEDPSSVAAVIGRARR